MTVLERNVKAAVRSAEDHRWFRGYLRGLLDGGRSREELELILERAHKHFRDAGDEEMADLALDGLDVLTGWCGPGMEISEPQNV